MPLKPLLGSEGVIRNGSQQGILFGLDDYLELVDCTGRVSRDDKRGSISPGAFPILERLNLGLERWCERPTRFEATHQQHCRDRREAA